MEIDFDAASAAWMANKIRRGPTLVYRCMQIQKNGNPCPLPAINECIPGKPHLCKRHGKKWVADATAPFKKVDTSLLGTMIPHDGIHNCQVTTP